MVVGIWGVKALSINCVQAVQSWWQNYVQGFTQLVCKTVDGATSFYFTHTSNHRNDRLPHFLFTPFSTAKNTQTTDVSSGLSPLYTVPITTTTIYI